ncbi:MAG: hypothetical protein ACTSPT_09305, partial [Candidatus Heimdallarchaeota archaeon]
NTNIDFIRGKRKSLASALYDVAKERGITNEGILYLIQSLPDFESFLYGTSAGKFYRDHTEHQLRVAVLGDFLLEQDVGNGQLLGIISELSGLDKDNLKNEVWWMMGLIHDIGYPLQKMTASINYSILNQILKCYPALDLEVIPLEISLAQKNTNQMEYLSFIEEGLSKEAIILIRNGAGLNHKTFPVPKVESFYGTESGHEEFKYNNPIKLDHGVIGALTILRSLGSPEEIKEKKDDYIGYIKAAQAIALHNFKDQIKDFNFDFKRFCKAKDSAFERLTRGKALQEVNIILRDFEVDSSNDQVSKSIDIDVILEAIKKTSDIQETSGEKKKKLLEEKAKKRDRRKEDHSHGKDLVKSTKKPMKLLDEHRITI